MASSTDVTMRNGIPEAQRVEEEHQHALARRSSLLAPSVSVAPRNGPRHGVQPKAKAAPITGGAKPSRRRLGLMGLDAAIPHEGHQAIDGVQMAVIRNEQPEEQPLTQPATVCERAAFLEQGS